MDRRLVEAARTGNVDYFLRLMEQDPFLLDNLSLCGAETPLHIASMCGHLLFVQKVLELRKQLACEKNQDGFSALHLASANGHVEVVKELLKLEGEFNICTIQGPEQRTALHCAVVKERIQVISELISASQDLVEMKTVRGETALHLAVKNNQIESFKMLVGYLKQHQKVNVLNEKDNQGNSILHHAALRRQYEVVDVMIKDPITRVELEVNSVNHKGMTALDILEQFLSEAGDLEIERTLLEAGAMRAKDNKVISSSQPAQIIVDQIPPASENSYADAQSRIGELAEFFRYKKGRDKESDVRTALLTVAILMATATYQAGLSPPGGVWEDDHRHENGTLIAPAGASVMGTRSWPLFAIFMVGNSLGFYLSLHLIVFLTIGFPLQLELWASMFSVVITYVASMQTIAPNPRMKWAFTLVSVGFPLLIPCVAKKWRKARA